MRKLTFGKSLIGLLLLATVWGESPKGWGEATPSFFKCSAQATVDCQLAETLTLSFRKDFEQVLVEAKAYLKTHKHRHGAVVLDLDETLLDNRAYFMVYKQYDPALWDQWIALAEAPALPETLEFVQWLRKKHVHVYFVSGRREYQRETTEANLRGLGIDRYDGLFLKPNDYQASTAADFKVKARQQIEAKGQPVVLILGDQASDLRGGYGQGFKLPNPVYTIP